jgi:hypothetical protein
MLNIYDGTLGSITDTKKIVSDLTNYLIKHTEPLNYEIVEDKTRVVLITGKNEEEKQITPFQHPIVFKDHKGRTTIAADLRLYMKNNLDNMINVTDYLADRYNGMLEIRRVIFNKIMLDGHTNLFAYVNKNLNLGLSSVVGTSVSLMVYDRDILDIASVATSIHYATMDMDEDKKIDIMDVIDLLPQTYVKRLLRGDLVDLKNRLISTEIILPSRYADDLINNIKTLSPNDRVKGLTVDMLIQGLSRTFYGLNSKELALGMLEHKPTYFSIYYAVLTEGINSRSTMRKILDSRKAIIKTKETIKVLTDIINDNMERY